MPSTSDASNRKYCRGAINFDFYIFQLSKAISLAIAINAYLAHIPLLYHSKHTLLFALATWKYVLWIIIFIVYMICMHSRDDNAACRARVSMQLKLCHLCVCVCACLWAHWCLRMTHEMIWSHAHQFCGYASNSYSPFVFDFVHNACEVPAWPLC